MAKSEKKIAANEFIVAEDIIGKVLLIKTHYTKRIARWIVVVLKMSIVHQYSLHHELHIL